VGKIVTAAFIPHLTPLWNIGINMKIKVYISREFDTDEWKNEDSLYPSDLDQDTEIQYAINMFAEDIDYLVKYNEVAEAARVEVFN
jgi:hypothetical protein